MFLPLLCLLVLLSYVWFPPLKASVITSHGPFNENFVSAVYHQEKFCFLEEQSKREIFPAACFLLLCAFVLCLFVFKATKLFKANSGRKESFRVFQREILGQSYSNVTDMETGRSNPKSEGVFPLTEINSGS